MNPKKTLVLTGPTACGKTDLALQMARRAKELKLSELEIINADSLLVYREMNIGTAKPTRQELEEVPHHLIDVLNPDQTFTAADFIKKTHSALDDIHSRGKRALIVGGTGFYLKALFFGLWEAPGADPALRQQLESEPLETLYQRLHQIDPQSALRVGSSDQYRLVRALELHALTGKSPTELQSQLPTSANPQFELGLLDRPTSELHTRIQKRTHLMIQKGLIDEVIALRSRYGTPRPLLSVGYKEVCRLLDGQAPEGRKVTPGIPGLIEEIELATRQLVKKQRTFFKGLVQRLAPDQVLSLDGTATELDEIWKQNFDRVYKN